MAGNPLLNRLARQSGSAHGGKSEKRLAKDLGGRLQMASGALAHAKSDILLGDFRIEAKSTNGESLALKRAWLEKISREAQSSGQTPALTISFVDNEGRAVMHTNSEWVAIPMWKFKEMIGG